MPIPIIPLFNDVLLLFFLLRDGSQLVALNLSWCSALQSIDSLV